MSLSWGESVRAALSPGQASLVRMGRGRPQMLRRNSTAADPRQPAWDAALAAFQEGLAALDEHGDGRGGKRGKKRDAEVTVVLSNHFVRYALVSWNDALAGEEEELAHARHCFSRIYGDAAESWDVRLSSGNDGQQVACAVDTGLLTGLDQAVSASGRRLNSVQPYLMAAFNRWRREFTEPLVWFVLAEQNRLCLSALQNEHWRELINLQTGADWVANLPALLARQRLLSGLDGAPGKVCVFAPDESAEQSLRQAGETVQGLHLPPLAEVPATEAGYFKMALNG